jgi:hypothetical protein
MTKVAVLRIAAAAALAGAILAPQSAWAQDETWKKDRFYFGLGLYRPDFETRVRVDDSVTGISGTLLNLEQDLDLTDRKTQATIDAHFRFAKRHALEFEWVKLSREDESSVGFVIDYDGEIIDIGRDVETTFETEVFRLAYRLSFINNEKMELSGALGLHVTDLTVGLNVIGEDPEFNDVTAPLPTLGGAFKYHFSENWTVDIRGEWLDIEIDDVNGKLTAGRIDLTWYPFRNFGASLGYHIWDLGVKASKDRLTGKVDYEYKGPKLTLNLRF